MPAILKGSRILVTGANGFIALSLIQALLDDGFNVRGTVRSVAKQDQLQQRFGSYGDRVEWVIVEDITKVGAFDGAVKDVDAIQHLASPISLPSNDPEAYITPAVEGTLGILNSALRSGLGHRPKLQRVVVTSSILAILNPPRNPPEIFDESNWADEVVEMVKNQGKTATADMKYRASKTLAEKAAWNFYAEHADNLKWDLVVLNPPLVLGQPLDGVKTPADLNQSMSVWYQMLFSEKPESVLKLTHAFMHVKDAAVAHVRALTNDAAGGQRILLSAGTMTWQGLRNLVHGLHPEYYDQGILPRGNAAVETTVTHTYRNEKSKDILGMKYRSYEEVISDIFNDFTERGWIVRKSEN